MYQWTHIELCRQQQNGPKKECVQNMVQGDLETIESDNISTCTLTESFASAKTKLISLELATDNTVATTETNAQRNEIEPINLDAEQMNKIPDELIHNVPSTIDCDDHLKTVELQNDCDNSLRKIYVETSTQTENIVEPTQKEKEPALRNASPPPPPPPPPPFLFNTPSTKTTNDINDKSNAPDTSITSQPNNQSIVPSAPSTTILSSASSFCAPPPPPMNGIPGPPPLPLPTGNMWFKSDSKKFIFSL